LTHFTELGLAAPILKALETLGYVTPTPIQAQSIPAVIAGRDLLGIAQTGTGKTAAFALPIINRLARTTQARQPKSARALILSPTRELASQIADNIREYSRNTGLTVTVVFGGVGHRPQVQALARGVDILVATPGRLLDHMEEGNVRFAATEVFVLDEADQMLDLGFMPAIRRIVKTLPKVRQNLFFSATMPTDIGKLASELLTDPVRVSVTPVATTVERVSQSVIHIESHRKKALLAELFANPELSRTLVFTRTKRGADRVAKYLEEAGVGVAAIHGNKSQSQREKALESFRSARIRALVATDIAARGIDIDDVTHVVNFELPDVPESYVHRIGRTARAGRSGIAISFCDNEERTQLRDIERLTRQTITAEDRRNGSAPEPKSGESRQARGGQQQNGRGRGDRNNRHRDRNRSQHQGRGEERRDSDRSQARNGHPAPAQAQRDTRGADQGAHRQADAQHRPDRHQGRPNGGRPAQQQPQRDQRHARPQGQRPQGSSEGNHGQQLAQVAFLKPSRPKNHRDNGSRPRQHSERRHTGGASAR
jgi:ATP-dependent RNA helicase RhlE